MRYRMGQKVIILKGQKLDGRYNKGRIFGVEKIQNGYYLGYKDEKEFEARFKGERYKVVYIDCFTNRAVEEWFYLNELIEVAHE